MSRINELQALVLGFSQNHLSRNSTQRINKVFDFFNNEQLLDVVFQFQSEYRPILKELSKDLQIAIDRNYF